MKLYVCYGTFTKTPRPGGHPCGNAHRALREAGHEPEVVKSYGAGVLPGIFNRTRGRREVKELTGQSTVPVLVTDDGEVIQDSKRIVEWARKNPAGTRAGSADAAGAPPAGSTS
ncbi:MAG: glutathione S-transferase domain-containing protein [Actinomycetota bacterium]|nr:glutathione S-transferase domain-containing protein [Actinomycetota bacterium]